MAASPVDIPTNGVGGLPFLHPLSRIFFGSLFDDSHSEWCEVVPYSFDLRFSNN